MESLSIDGSPSGVTTGACAAAVVAAASVTRDKSPMQRMLFLSR
jgi:cobalamin biosynthesis protein CbiD